MGREEQIEEREVLDSIFPDEITGEISVSIPAVNAHALTLPFRHFRHRISYKNNPRHTR